MPDNTLEEERDSGTAIEAGPWDAFVSYSRRDKEAVVELVVGLEGAGHRVWIDLEDIAPSTEWMAKITEGIANSNAFLLCVSPDSVASVTTREEVELAERFGKRIITLLLRPTPPSDLPEPAARIQWIDATAGIDATAIGEVLVKDLDWVEQHTYLLRRALDWQARDREAALLLRAQDLDRAEEALALSAGKQPHFSKLHLDLIASSRESRRKKERVRLWTVTAIALVMGLLAVLAFWQSHLRERQRKIAVAKELGTRAVLVRDQQGRGPALSALLGVEALDRLQGLGAHSVEAAEALVAALSVLPDRILWLQPPKRSADLDLNLDGTRLAVVSGSGPALIWSDRSLEPVQRLENPAQDNRQLCRFDDQGRYLLILFEAQGARQKTRWQVWDSEQEVLLSAPSDQDGTFNHGAMHPRGQFFAIADREVALVFSIPTMHQVARVWAAGEISAISFAAEGDSFRVDSAEPQSRTDREPRQLFREQWQVGGWSALPGEGPIAIGEPPPDNRLVAALDSSARAFRLGPNGRYLVTSTGPLQLAGNLAPVSLSVWQRDDPRRRRPGSREVETRFRRIATANSARGVTDLRFSRNGEHFATAAYDYTARLWNSSSGRQIARVDHEITVRGVAISGRGDRFATTGSDGVGLWQRNPGWIDRQLAGRTNLVTRAMTFSTDGKLLAVQTTLGFELWDLETGELRNRSGGRLSFPRPRSARPVPVFHPNPQSPVFVAGDQKVLVSSREGVTTFDLEGKPLGKLSHDPAEVTALDPRGRLVAMADRQRTKVYSLQTGLEVATWEVRSRHLAFDSPGRYLVVAGSQHGFFWDTSDSMQLPLPGSERTRAVAFATVDSLLAVASQESIKILALPDLEVIEEVPTGWAVGRLALSRDSALVGLASQGRVAVWDRERRRFVLDEENERLQALSFAPDNQTLAVYGRHRPIQLWTQLRSDAPFQRLRIPETESVWTVVFSPDGRFLALGSSADLIKLTPVTTAALVETAHQRVPRNLTAEEWETFLGAEKYRCTIPTLPPCGPARPGSPLPAASSETPSTENSEAR